METTKTNTFVESMWDVTYFEFSEQVDKDYTLEKVEVKTDLGLQKEKNHLGGDLIPVNWYDKDGKVR